jgi:RES domain-containing protein
MVYRVMLGDYPPERENRVGARWNPPDLAAIYTSSQAATAVAEVEYHLAQQPLPLKRTLKKTLYTIGVELGAVVDIATVLPQLAKAGVAREQLLGTSWHNSQDIGRLVTWFGHDGLWVPSARGDGSNLVIFPSRANSETYRFEVVEQKEL